MAGVQIDFQLAVHKRDRLKKGLDRRKQKGVQIEKSILAGLEAEHRLWRSLAIAACPGHQYEDILDEYVPEGEAARVVGRRCTVCDGVADSSDEIVGAVESVTKGCHNCAHYDRGDSSVGVWPGCGHSDVEDWPSEKTQAMEKDSGNCPLWEGA